MAVRLDMIHHESEMGEEREQSEFDCYIIVPYNSFMNLSKAK